LAQQSSGIELLSIVHLLLAQYLDFIILTRSAHSAQQKTSFYHWYRNLQHFPCLWHFLRRIAWGRRL